MTLIPLWRNKPPEPKLLGGLEKNEDSSLSNKITISKIFPSGRQAISKCLMDRGISRSDLVALPEWSGYCLISSVARVATPVPLKEVIKNEIDCAAIIIYEQWGWEFSSSALQSFINHFKGKILILDRVDSVKLYDINKNKFTFQIWSLSKTLGFNGGGIALNCSKEFLSFLNTKPEETIMIDKILKVSTIDSNIKNYLNKAYGSHREEDLINFINSQLIDNCFLLESEERKKRSKILLENFPDDALESNIKNGSAPGIFPLALNKSKSFRENVLHNCLSLNIEAKPYHFNYSMNPIKPEYIPCVAVPVHSGVPINLLKKLLVAL